MATASETESVSTSTLPAESDRRQNRPMDSIRFDVSPWDMGGASFMVIEPIINEVPLRELAEVVEAPFASAEGKPQLAGSYAGLGSVERLRWPSRHYLGDPIFSWFDTGDTVLLGCECGEWGCWPLTAQVEVADDTVRWSGFRTGHRDWNLASLGPFEFDRREYEHALGRSAEQ